jgi:hypothetical protein
MRPKSNNCLDCGEPILKSSKRCRACNLKVVGKPGWNRIGDHPLTGAEKAARWRDAHPDRAKETRDRARQSKRDWIANYKAKNGCASCGIKDHRILDLHHVNSDGKDMAVSQLYNRASWKTIKEEVSKCEVLCANCHRIAHYEAR